MPDDLTLKVGGATLSGWTEVRVTRRLEGMPNDFQVTFTDRFPGEPAAVVVKEGDPCVASIGDDTVVTGYVDTFMRGYGPTGHTYTIAGRGKCQDLVDCSATYPGSQFTNMTLGQIAEALAKPYGIAVVQPADPGPVIPQLLINGGETAFEIIEPIARYAAVLAYEDENGALVLAAVGKKAAASGFKEGVNVLAAQASSSLLQRYSDYACSLVPLDWLQDHTGPGPVKFTAKDPNVPRFRNLFFLLDTTQGAPDLAQKRVYWEASRRAGRGRQVKVTADSWRDSAGALWAPNTLAPVSLPGLKLEDVTWTISEVAYIKTAQGTLSDVKLMDPSAFAPDPINLFGDYQDVKRG